MTGESAGRSDRRHSEAGLNSTHNLRVTRQDCHCGCRYCGDLDDLSGVQIVRAHSKYSVGICPEIVRIVRRGKGAHAKNKSTSQDAGQQPSFLTRDGAQKPMGIIEPKQNQAIPAEGGGSKAK
jgi:hypothetical protein